MRQTRWLGGGRLEFLGRRAGAGRVGKLLYEGILGRELPARRAALTTTFVHWGYGIQWGMLFGMSMGSPGAAVDVTDYASTLAT